MNEYRFRFAFDDYELGCTHLLEMDIEEKPGSEVVCSKPYKASAGQRKTMQTIVNEWKSAGLVTETNSSYASPCLLVQRANGMDRLVVDFRRLNKNTSG